MLKVFLTQFEISFVHLFADFLSDMHHFKNVQ